MLTLQNLIEGYPLDNGFYKVHTMNFTTNTIQDITNHRSSKIENIAEKDNMLVFMMSEGVVQWLSSKPSAHALNEYVKGDLVEEMLDIII